MIKKFFLKLIKSPLFWVLFVEAVILTILYFAGFRISYSPGIDNNWDAISAIGQWFGVISGVFIPLAAIYIQYKLDKSKKIIGASNVDVLNEIDRLKLQFKLMGSHINEESLKEKVLKYINISMIAKTDKVAEHFNISIDQAYDILEELLLHDRAIKSGGQVSRENMYNIIWLRK